MQLKGDEQFPHPVTHVWNCLNNPKHIAEIIPGKQQVLSCDADSFSCKVEPSLSFLSSSLTLNFEYTKRHQESDLELLVSGKGIGMGVKLAIQVALEPCPEGTLLIWTAKVLERSGLLQPLGDSLVEGAAQHIVRELWLKFGESLD